MDKIELCNPNARILRHMNLNTDRVKRNISSYIGLTVQGGTRLNSFFDVMSYIDMCERTGKKINCFGHQHCSNLDCKTGACLGHTVDDTNAPKDFAITYNSDDFGGYGDGIFHDIMSGRVTCYPKVKELNGAKVGDFITLRHGDVSVKLVITSTLYSCGGVTGYGIWLVLQRTKANGKIQYFI